MGDKIVRTFVIIIIAVLAWLLVGWFMTMMAIGIPAQIMSIIGLLIFVLVLWYVIHNVWGFI
jgi:hypothetical protein